MQAELRSGPGRWLRQVPVLDWRRLLERTNRISPQAPLVSFTLCDAPGQAIWPPPAAPVALRPSAPAPIYTAGQLPVRRQSAATAAREPQALLPGSPAARVAEAQEREQLHTAASEAETLVSVQGASPGAQQQQQYMPAHLASSYPNGQGSKRSEVGGSCSRKPAVPQLDLQAWQIHAHYDGSACSSAGAGAPDAEQLWRPPALPSIRTRLQQQAQHVASSPLSAQQEADALYAGSPTAKQARRGLAATSAASLTAPEAALAAAGAAVPAAEVAGHTFSLKEELSDALFTSAASLQLLAFEAEPGAGAWLGGGEQLLQPALPQRLHFTFRFFHSSQPTITAPVHLLHVHDAAGCTGSSGSSGGGGRAELYALASEVGQPGFSRHGSVDARPAPELPLQLLDAAALEQQAAQLAAGGAPPAVAASLVRQQRLRAVQYLADRRLQVDIWDSDSLLQVGGGLIGWVGGWLGGRVVVLGCSGRQRHNTWRMFSQCQAGQQARLVLHHLFCFARSWPDLWAAERGAAEREAPEHTELPLMAPPCPPAPAGGHPVGAPVQPAAAGHASSPGCAAGACGGPWAGG